MELVVMENNYAVTTSLIVAEVFGKNHRDVLEKIRKLDDEVRSAENSAQPKIGLSATTDFEVSTENLFTQTSYIDTSGKSNKMYNLTRDGFTLLAMGFTGAKALQWKLKYIEAFNKMETSLKKISKQAKLNIEDRIEKLKFEITALKETSKILGFTKEEEIEAVKKVYKNIGVETNLLPERITDILTAETPRVLLKRYNVSYGDYTLYRKLERAGIIEKYYTDDGKWHKWILKDEYWGINKEWKVKLYEQRFIELIRKIERV